MHRQGNHGQASVARAPLRRSGPRAEKPLESQKGHGRRLQEVGWPAMAGRPGLSPKTASSGEGVRQPCTSRKPTRFSSRSYSASVHSFPSVQTSMLSDCICTMRALPYHRRGVSRQ